jgi:RNA polymerase sigma factor (sigma-70 family)
VLDPDQVARAIRVARAACRRWLPTLPVSHRDEIVQDTLEVVWRKQPVDGAPFEAFVAAVARNLCRNALKKRRDVLTGDGVLDPPDPADDVLHALERADDAARVRRALAGMSATDRALLVARYVLDLDRAELADRLGLGPNAVRGGLARALQRLRARLQRAPHGAPATRSRTVQRSGHAGVMPSQRSPSATRPATRSGYPSVQTGPYAYAAPSWTAVGGAPSAG